MVGKIGGEMTKIQPVFVRAHWHAYEMRPDDDVVTEAEAEAHNLMLENSELKDWVTAQN